MSDITEAIPIRMINEFVYCPRLFYYEQVEGIFVSNADTAEGSSQHKRVDKGKSRLAKGEKPAAAMNGEEGEGGSMESVSETIHAHSVMLGSERLGVTAKMDLIEATALADGSIAEVIPVEYKKGAPREGDEGKELWDTDKIQLGLQILILRDNGYRCDKGVLFYRETRQRIELQMDAETEAWIENRIVAARACASGGSIPRPLDHSPKCPRCSLVSVCLPDETRSLQPAEDFAEVQKESGQLTLELECSELEPKMPDLWEGLPEVKFPSVPTDNIRRLIAPNPETRALYLNTAGHYLSKKDETFVVKENGKIVGEFLAKDIHHVAIYGPVQVSTSVIQSCCEREIPMAWYSMGGWFYGITHGHTLKNVFTRIKQFHYGASPELSLLIASRFIHGKIRNQRTFLMRNHINPPKSVLHALKWHAAVALSATSLQDLYGVEGSAAALYFEQFPGMLKQQSAADDIPLLPDLPEDKRMHVFHFKERNRRPPRDPINALLSFAYALLAKDCTIAAWVVGFDPYVGFLHQPRFGRPSLALDVMEEFRPLVADSVVIGLINNRMLQPSDFVFAGETVSVSPKSRKVVIQAYEKRMNDCITHPVFGYKVSYRRAIELQYRLLARVLTGEIAHYIPFLTR